MNARSRMLESPVKRAAMAFLFLCPLAARAEDWEARCKALSAGTPAGWNAWLEANPSAEFREPGTQAFRNYNLRD